MCQENLSQFVSRGDMEDLGRDGILGRALNIPEHSGRVRGVGYGISRKKIFPPVKRPKRSSQDQSEKLIALEEKNTSLQSEVKELKDQLGLVMQMLAAKVECPHKDNIQKTSSEDSCPETLVVFPEVIVF